MTGRRLTLREALEVLNLHRDHADRVEVLLACGFTPLHFGTFLAAYCQLSRPGQQVRVSTGLYGDLTGTLASAGEHGYGAVLAMIEWSDLDARLGLRQLGGWSPASLPEIQETVKIRLKLITQALERVALKSRVVVAPPVLPPAPVFFTPTWQRSAAAARLHAELAEFLANLTELGVTVLEPAHYPAGERMDLKALLHTGLPFPKDFAGALASHFAETLFPATPKKGLITDLDDTVWQGILGEVGADGVQWDLDHGAQVHGIYQTLVQSLADSGVLVGVASKNDTAGVDAAMQRSDLLLKPQSLFPIEAHWSPKSESAARIIRAWNISADAVVFVDDSPMELAEVAAAHPGITTLRFPAEDEGAAWEFFHQLRDLFGKSTVSEEDRIRLESLRRAAELQTEFSEDGNTLTEEFLASANADVEIESPLDAGDKRALELVNKTNQFNLNGRRYTDAEWHASLTHPESVSLACSYRDRFGPLGKIAVVAGHKRGSDLFLHTWVMSCRAFSRRIEHLTIRHLFDTQSVDRIVLDLEETAKNKPARDCLATLGAEGPVIRRDSFAHSCPRLYHTVHTREVSHGRN